MQHLCTYISLFFLLTVSQNRMSMELKPGWQSTNYKSEVLSTALWASRYILNIVGKLQNQVAYHVNENMFEIHDLSKREPKALNKKTPWLVTARVPGM